jgi:hypothetical protein
VTGECSSNGGGKSMTRLLPYEKLTLDGSVMIVSSTVIHGNKLTLI